MGALCLAVRDQECARAQRAQRILADQGFAASRTYKYLHLETQLIGLGEESHCIVGSAASINNIYYASGDENAGCVAGAGTSCLLTLLFAGVHSF